MFHINFGGLCDLHFSVLFFYYIENVLLSSWSVVNRDLEIVKAQLWLLS